MADLLKRLDWDAGGLTFGDLIEDRVRAVEEIRRFGSELESLKVRSTMRWTRRPDLAPPRDAAGRILKFKSAVAFEGVEADDGVGAFDTPQDGW
jgi:hypothetical protein